MSMGNWRLKKQKKGLRASRTHSKKARIYLAYPPPEGWKSGTPEANEYKER